MKNSFVHLHVHTEYSLLDGFARIDRLFDAVLEKGMDAIAITDHGVLFGAVEFYQKAKKAGVKPIIGCEVYVAPGDVREPQKERYHLILLAKNEIGYRNLVKLVSLGFTEGFYYKPRVDLAWLRTYAEGLICLSSCIQGAISSSILAGDLEGAKRHALAYRAIYGDDFYLELQDHGLPEQIRVNRGILYLADQLGIPVVATNDVHYIDREDAKAHDVLLCIQTGKNYADADRMRFPNDQFYLKSPEEMAALFGAIPEALENTRRIADLCQFDFTFHELHLPKYPDPVGLRELVDRCLRAKMESGFPYRYEEIRERLEHELSTIYEMGYDDYIVIVWDFIKKAREMGIVVGPGRGSGGGSLVAWILGITEVDPIKYGLIFERFLNAQRVTMPDLDIDFEDERRHEVIEYVKQKYGASRVAHIITFGTLAARAAFRDVARVLDIPYAITDKAAKEIPAHLGVTLESALRENPKLPQLLAASPELAQVYEIARALEGVPRHASTHAAGVLVTRDDVANHVPLYLNNTTQYTMNALSDLGLLKMDFLGIRTLSVIKHAVASAEKRLGASVDPDLQDDAVYELLSTGHTIGLFQLESTGFRRFIRELKPHCFEDIVDAISLYRPGPMSAIPKYLENRHRQAEIRYDHPLLRPILEATHGVLIYQEQVMRIARDLAGYDYGRSDVLRDAMGKKKYAVMQRERDVFLHGDSTYAPGSVPDSVPGCVRNGVPIEVAEKLFDDMAEFAKYAFNKSHAVGYAILAYRTAYLKTKHPIEYMAALLSTVVSMRGLLTRYTNECFRMKIPVKPPSVNFSMPDFTPEGDGIRFGFLAIKHVGRSVAQAIVESRKSGPFTSFYDFVDRIPRSELNKKAVECLIFAGAFDEFGNTRTQLIGVYDTLIDVRSASRSRDDAQISMFQSGAIETEHLYAPMPNLPEYPPDQKLELEKEVLGVYLSGHPLDAHRDLFERYATMSLSELKEIAASDNPGQVDSMRFVLPCYVRSKKEQNTKKGERMAFLVVEDFDDQIEVVLFPKVFAKYHGEDKILIRGTVQLRDEDPKLIAEAIEALDPQRLQANLSVESRSRETKRSTAAGSAATNSSADSAAADRPQIPRPTLYLRFQSTEPEKLKRIEEMLRTMRTNRRPSGSPYRVIFYLADKAKQKVAYEILYLDIAQKQELEDWMGSENFREKRV